MAGLIGDLVDVLQQEAKSYETLLNYSKHKTQLIVANNVQEIREQVEKEEKEIRVLSKLELQREEIIKKIAGVLKISAKELKISELVPVLEKAPEDQKALIKVQEDMTKVIEELQKTNKNNKQLIQGSLDYIDFSINLINSANNVPQQSYTGGGTESYGGSGSQSYFDFKR